MRASNSVVDRVACGVEAVRLILLMAPRDHEFRGTKNCYVLSRTKHSMLNKNSLTMEQEIPCLLGKLEVTVCTRADRRSTFLSRSN